MNPKCFRCGAGHTSFSTRLEVFSHGPLVVLYCENCGAVQGVVRQQMRK